MSAENRATYRIAVRVDGTWRILDFSFSSHSQACAAIDRMLSALGGPSYGVEETSARGVVQPVREYGAQS